MKIRKICKKKKKKKEKKRKERKHLRGRRSPSPGRMIHTQTESWSNDSTNTWVLSRMIHTQNSPVL